MQHGSDFEKVSLLASPLFPIAVCYSIMLE